MIHYLDGYDSRDIPHGPLVRAMRVRDYSAHLGCQGSRLGQAHGQSVSNVTEEIMRRRYSFLESASLRWILVSADNKDRMVYWGWQPAYACCRIVRGADAEEQGWAYSVPG